MSRSDNVLLLYLHKISYSIYVIAEKKKERKKQKKSKSKNKADGNKKTEAKESAPTSSLET